MEGKAYRRKKMFNVIILIDGFSSWKRAREKILIGNSFDQQTLKEERNQPHEEKFLY